MTLQPVLSIVTATRGNFSDYWLEQLLNIKGNVEFVLVYPPASSIKPIDDPRVKNLVSSSKGEVIQRFTGLLNASGKYVIALDDDDYLHPDLLSFTTTYFDRFPESWVLRLKKENIDIKNEADIQRPWEEIPDIGQLEVKKRARDKVHQVLIEIPIVPLNKTRLNLLHILFPFVERKDMHGIHMENFNNRIWRTELVQSALSDLSQAMKLFGSLTWLPSWSLDRLLGLYVQAKFFEEDAVVGHWMPKPAQIRYIDRPSSSKEMRFYVLADILLVKRFPRYHYFWNLVLWQISTTPRIFGKALKARWSKA
jgi:glycosyltransferase involved in cell wall biosynthesis